MTEFLDSLALWAESLAGTPWVFVVLYLFATIDGFFPPIPSESVIIALAALFVATDSPDFWILGAVAAAGAFSGDQIAYSIGRHIPIRRMRFMQGAKAQKAVAWAERALEERGASFIIAARYVPVGRVAVNMTAGAVGFPRFRFSALAVVAAISWSIYSVLLGVGAGHLLGEQNPLLAMAVGVAGGLVLGVVVDAVLRWWGRRRGRRDGVVSDAVEEGAAGAGTVEQGTVETGAEEEPTPDPVASA